MQQPLDPFDAVVACCTGTPPQPPDVDCPRRVIAHPRVTTFDPAALAWDLYHAPAADSEGGTPD